MSAEGLNAALSKMRDGGVHPTALEVFSHYYRQLESGATGIISESDLEPLTDPTRLVDLDSAAEAGRDALDVTAVIKVNGGLGTSMGMQQAKTLLPVREGLTFLDIIVRQVLRARARLSVKLPLIFMNSFRTSEDTLAALAPYPELAVDGLPLDFLQNREPKLRADDLMPVEWSADPSLEWCPPGHGDIYTALAASGVLTTLLDAGYRYVFLSNADNLRAIADPRVAGWFASGDAPFASEVCPRTPADRKGGHLAIRKSDQQLVLRETAQTAPEDEAAFADLTRHRYFNCNNLWIDLQAMDATLQANAGVLGLPLIRNEKTVDPADASSPKVIQIETAMGSAVEVFPGARAIEVERTRFLPVKSTNDLLGLRSDVQQLSDDYTMQLADGLREAPLVDLDPDYYKLVMEFDQRFPEGPPSLVKAKTFRVRGDWTFRADTVIEGDTEIPVDSAPGTWPPGQGSDESRP